MGLVGCHKAGEGVSIVDNGPASTAGKSDVPKAPSDPSAVSPSSVAGDKSSDPKPADSKPVDVKPGDPKPGDAKTTGDSKSGADGKAVSDTVPGDQKPATTDPVSDSVKTDGFAYYGLGNKEPIKLELKIPSQKRNYTGSATPIFKDTVGEIARYVITRTGELKDLLGDEIVEARPDGIYVIGNSMGALSKPTLDLPANPKKGFKWRVKSVLKTKNETIRQNIMCNVIGVVSVDDHGKKADALLVKTNGYVTLGGKLTPTSAKYWYEKNVGLIRTDLRVTPEGQKPVVMVMGRISGDN
jgi:hypothetical protein